MKKCAYCHAAIVAGSKFLRTGKEKYMHAGCFREMYKDFPVAEVIKLCKVALLAEGVGRNSSCRGYFM